MNFNHLEFALAVSKYGSISKASQNLFVSQPYLSGMIKGLEDELGYKLFVRNKSGAKLTQQGQEFMKSAKIILLEIRKIKELHEYNDIKPLSISCFYATYIMKMFLKFKNISPIKLPDKIKEMGNKEVMESILSGDSTIGIVFNLQEKQKKYEDMAEDLGLDIKVLFKPMSMYAIMSDEHPLASESEISLAELKKHPYVSYDDASSKMFLKFIGIEEHSQFLEVSDRGSLYDALSSGEYISTMAFKNKNTEEGLILIPIKDKQLLLNSSYVISRNYKLTKREKDFLQFIQRGGVVLDV